MVTILCYSICYLHRRYSEWIVGLIAFVILLGKITVHSCWSICQMKKKRSVWRVLWSNGIILFPQNTQFSHQCGLQKKYFIGGMLGALFDDCLWYKTSITFSTTLLENKECQRWFFYIQILPHCCVTEKWKKKKTLWLKQSLNI